MKSLLIICAWLLFISPAPLAELEQIINGLQAKYLRLNSLQADFIQTYNAPGERTRRESGRLQLKKSGKMRWEYSSPETKIYVSDGKVIYEYLPADRSATRTNAKTAADWRTPFLFLLGRGNLRRDFARLEWADEAPVRAGNKVLRLIPKRASDIRALLVEVEPKTFNLTRLSFIRSGNVRIDFLLNNMQENVNLPDTNFIFTPPAGVTIRQQ